jgi:hypothetical protein
LVGEVVSKAIGLLLQLAISDLFVSTDQRNTVGHGINGVLSKIGNIQGHKPKLERVTFPFKSRVRMQEGRCW